jgi:Mg-chelatase subunit ChlD
MIIEQHNVYNLIILDESGSMQSIKAPTIRGFNEVVQTIKEVEEKFPQQKHFVSFVTFNTNGTKLRLWNQEVSKLQLIDENLFNPSASTPLYDAIGQSISRLKETISPNGTYNVLVTILTDGEENSSRIFSQAQISRMIEELKSKSWTFAYIGANHDVITAARGMGIDNTMKFEANEKDMEMMFLKEKKARLSMADKMSHMSMKFDNISFNKDYYEEEKPEPKI